MVGLIKLFKKKKKTSETNSAHMKLEGPKVLSRQNLGTNSVVSPLLKVILFYCVGGGGCLL